MPKPIVNLKEYSSEWQNLFDYERNEIIGVIGNEIDRIEHIGSTSVKGLKAKPIIDIMVGVEDLTLTPMFITPLNEIGYEYVPKPEFKDREFFRKGEWGQGTFHLHLIKTNSVEWVEKLLFREYLRKHPQAAEEYALLKSELATKYKNDRSTYTNKKEPFIKAILEKAKINT